MTLNRVLLRLLQLGLLVVVAWFIIRTLAPQLEQLTWADLVRWRPRWLPLLASFLLLLSIYFAHALLWRQIVLDLGIGRPTSRAAARMWFLASLGRYVPGRVWQLASMAVLARRAGLPALAASAASALGHACYLAMGVLLLSVAMPDFARSDSARAVGGLAPLILAGMLLGVALLWLGTGPRARRAHDTLVRWLGPRLGERARAVLALAERIRPRDALVWTFGYGLTWIMLGAAFVLFVAAFVPAAAAAPRYLTGTIAASYLVGYVLPLPAGIGGREAVMLWLLSPLLNDPGAALVISVLSRVWFTAAELLPLALLPLLPDRAAEEVGT